MIETTKIRPGVTLRCCRDTRFKQGCLSFQFVRPMDAAEAHLNALLPSVMLRATELHPDLQSISQHLDSLYGVSLGALVRRVGDYQTVGFYCSFMDDRFALPGESVLQGVTEFLSEVCNRPLLKDGGFLPEIVESEKKNLVATIESELNNKAHYAMNRLFTTLCRRDSFGVPRLGEKEQVETIDPEGLYAHYRKIRREAPLEIFYVGSAPAEIIAGYLGPVLENWDRACISLPAQTALEPEETDHLTETMDIAQGKLCMGFTTPITNRMPEFPAMQVFNTIFGAGMTSKLFTTVREKLSLCYSVGSSYYGTKGIVTVSAGIDFDKEEQTRQEILRQLEACRTGRISPEELDAAKAAICSSLRSTHDSPGAIEGYYSTAALSGMGLTPAQYMAAVEALTVEQVVAAANTVTYRASFFLKGDTK